MALSGRNELAFAQALVVFSNAWEAMAKASLACPDVDVSDMYPFYLLDYEEIAPAVKAWCLHHASILMRNAPDKVYNPDCFDCPFAGEGLDPETGLCKGYNSMHCARHPYIIFTPEAVKPFLMRQLPDTDLSDLTDISLEMLYLQVFDKGKKGD